VLVHNRLNSLYLAKNEYFFTADFLTFCQRETFFQKHSFSCYGMAFEEGRLHE
jgi:hypothetical protein